MSSVGRYSKRKYLHGRLPLLPLLLMLIVRSWYSAFTAFEALWNAHATDSDKIDLYSAVSVMKLT